MHMVSPGTSTLPVALSFGTVSVFIISTSYIIFFDSVKSGEGRKPKGTLLSPSNTVLSFHRINTQSGQINWNFLLFCSQKCLPMEVQV